MEFHDFYSCTIRQKIKSFPKAWGSEWPDTEKLLPSKLRMAKLWIGFSVSASFDCVQFVSCSLKLAPFS